MFRRSQRSARPLFQPLESRTMLAANLPVAFDFGPNATPIASDMDRSGNVWVVGTFQGALDVNPSSRKTHTLDSSTGSHFIVRYDSLGRLGYADNFEAEPGSQIVISDLKTDEGGNAVIVGSLVGSMDFNLERGVYYRTTKTPSTDLPANQDVFVWKLNTSGGLISASLYSHITSTQETADHLALDSSNNLYITGTYNENVDDTIVRAYVQKITRGGSVGFFQTLSDQLPTAIGLNNKGEIYVAAHAGATPDTAIKINRFGNSGKLISSLAFTEGTPGAIEVTGFAFDTSDNVWMTGNLTGTADFNTDPNGALALSSNAGSQDIFVAKYRANSAPRAAFLIGADGTDTAAGIGVNRRDNSVTIGGSFAGAVDFNASPRKNFTIDTGSSLQADLFLAHYNSGGGLIDAADAGFVDSSNTAVAFRFTPARSMIMGTSDLGAGEKGVVVYQDLLA